jgi:hypothetical protein
LHLALALTHAQQRASDDLVCEDPDLCGLEGHSRCKDLMSGAAVALCSTRNNLVSHAGLVPLMELAEKAGLSALLDKHVRFTSERVTSGAANATPKLIITGMAGGAGRYR